MGQGHSDQKRKRRWSSTLRRQIQARPSTRSRNPQTATKLPALQHKTHGSKNLRARMETRQTSRSSQNSHRHRRRPSRKSDAERRSVETKYKGLFAKLDYALPDYVFDSDEGEDIQECIGNVWEEIDKIEKQMGEKLCD